MTYNVGDIVRATIADGTKVYGRITKHEGMGYYIVKPFDSDEVVITTPLQFEVLEEAPEKTLEGAQEAIREVVDSYAMWDRGLQSPSVKASMLLELNNAIANLATWHKDYDPETGTIQTEDE